MYLQDEDVKVQEINLDAFDNYVGGGDVTVAPESRLTNGLPEANGKISLHLWLYNNSNP